MTANQNLANKIALFFDRYDMLGGATVYEMYEVVHKALEENNQEEIHLIKEYFRDIRWANDRAQELYRQLDLWY